VAEGDYQAPTSPRVPDGMALEFLRADCVMMNTEKATACKPLNTAYSTKRRQLVNELIHMEHQDHVKSEWSENPMLKQKLVTA
jgi:hypothetical protein